MSYSCWPTSAGHPRNSRIRGQGGGSCPPSPGGPHAALGSGGDSRGGDSCRAVVVICGALCATSACSPGCNRGAAPLLHSPGGPHAALGRSGDIVRALPATATVLHPNISWRSCPSRPRPRCNPPEVGEAIQICPKHLDDGGGRVMPRGVGPAALGFVGLEQAREEPAEGADKRAPHKGRGKELHQRERAEGAGA